MKRPHVSICQSPRANVRLLSACAAVVAAVICLAPVLLPAGASSQPTARAFEPSSPQDEHWARGFHAPGVAGMDADVSALAVGPDGSIYAAGTFVTAGDVSANGIARWNVSTSSWHALGSGMSGGSSYTSHVYAVAVGLDGSVYAGGEFTQAGGVAANNIARWDAATSLWQPLGSGLDSDVEALALGPDGSLYAGGRFNTAGGVAANHIARWDGAQWHPLGGGVGIVNGYGVHALAFGPDGSLYAGGGFTMAGGFGANRIAHWDGNAWYPLGDGITGSNEPFGCQVFALAVAPDGILYAAGSFTTAGGTPATNIARWDGTIWHRLRHGLPNAAVFALAVGPDGSVYAGNLGGDSRIRRWDGADWQDMDGGMPGGYWVHALVAGLDGSIYAGGQFDIAGQVGAASIARWDGALWHPLGSGNGMSSVVRVLAAGPAGSLYAGGTFRTAGDRIVERVAAWDGAAWQPLGGGTNGGVSALAVGPDGSLYAGGEFEAAGGITANNIARWDSSTSSWNALGSGMEGYSGVYALLVSPDGSLYAGGGFYRAGGTPAYGIARWDSMTSSWHALGSGVTGGYSVAVRALAMSPDGALFVGGHFTTAGGVGAGNLARWDPTTSSWQAVGSGMNGAVLALAVGPDGSLYAGGSFTSAGGVPAAYVARWDGEWHALGGGMSASAYGTSVNALAFASDGTLYAGGNFTIAGGVQAYRIARWDGATWQPLAGGVEGKQVPEVFALAFDSTGSLYAGGDFSTAGGVPSAFIARWDAFPLFVGHQEAEGVARTGTMQRGEDGGASACYYVYDTIPWSGSSITFDVTVPYDGNYYLWARAMGLDWDQNSFWVSVDGAPFFHYEIGQFGGQWIWGWEPVHVEGQPVAPFTLSAGRHTVVFNSREILSRLDAIVLASRAGYIPTQITPCGATLTPTTTNTPTVTATATSTSTATPTVTPTATFTPTSTPMATATPTATPVRRYLPLILHQ